MKVVKKAVDIQIFSYSEYPTAVVLWVLIRQYMCEFMMIYGAFSPLYQLL